MSAIPPPYTAKPLPPAIIKRLTQLSTANGAISIETRKLLGELHKEGFVFPSLYVYALRDIDRATFTLSILLQKEYTLDAANQAGRDDRSYNWTDSAEATAEDRRSETPE